MQYGRYFWSLVTSESLDAELMNALSNDPDMPVDISALPRRKWLRDQVGAQNEVLDGRHRSAALSVSMTIILRTEGNNFDLLLPPRSGKVATHPFFNHVAPSGIFQPFDEKTPSPTSEFSVERAILREYVEELYDDPTYRRGSQLSPDPLEEPEIIRLRRLIQRGHAELLYTGISVNLLTLRPEICMVLLVHEPGWLRAEITTANNRRRPFRLGWEYLDIPRCDDLHDLQLRQPFLQLDAALEPLGSHHVRRSARASSCRMPLLPSAWLYP